MPSYLTKEEIRQWRSSLEKITLEEFAARLGKSVEEKKSGCIAGTGRSHGEKMKGFVPCMGRQR